MAKQLCQIEIQLKSDLCVGSGYSYAGIIDRDICHDETGLPYIPAKRIKGCLREAAKLIHLSKSDELFGVAGQDEINKRTAMVISNAYLKEHEKIREVLSKIGNSSNLYAQFMTPQKILEQYTTVKAQTRLEASGVAKEKSLHFTRTVNQYSPINPQEELLFYANIEYEDKVVSKEELEKIVKALRHMGINRNRGLGNVRCRLIKAKNENKYRLKISKSEDINQDSLCTLSYLIKAEQPLVISKNNNSVSESYISGQSVLGYFSGAYLRDGYSADTEEFEELFLKNQVIFSALYPTEMEEDVQQKEQEKVKSYFPAPLFISRLKKTKVFVNTSKEHKKINEAGYSNSEEGKRDRYWPKEGNQPKKLSGKYICMDDNVIDLKEVETDIIYHHRRRSKDWEEQLYSLQVIKEHQYFSGTITGRLYNLEKLFPYVSQGLMHFGKSKNAQYGTCRVLKADIALKETLNQRFPKGSHIMVILQSDGLFMDNCGYTADNYFVRNEICKELGIEEMEPGYSEIEVRELNGYYRKWNLRRQSIPVVCAGSSFELILQKDFIWKSDMVGERNGEGYGKISIINNTNGVWEMEERKDVEKKSDKVTEIEQNIVNELKRVSAVGGLCRQSILQSAMKVLEERALEQKNIGLSASTIGRITLMLTESLNENSENMDNAYQSFRRRLLSIKNKDSRSEAWKFVNDFIKEEKLPENGLSKDEIEKQKYCLIGCIYIKRFLGEFQNWYNKISENEDCFEKQMRKQWGKYLMMILVSLKYAKKGEL